MPKYILTLDKPVKQYGWFLTYFGATWTSTHDISLPDIDEDEYGYLIIKDDDYIQHSMSKVPAVRSLDGFPFDLFIRIPISPCVLESITSSSQLDHFYDFIDKS